MDIKCPKCGNVNIVFCGLKPDGKGGYDNSWECLSKVNDVDCDNKWTTKIENINIDERRV